MARPRDSQFAKFWKAAAVLEPFDIQFKTDRGMEGFVRRTVQRAFLLRRYPLVNSFRVAHLPAHQRETASAWMIGVPVSRRDMRTVIFCLTRLIWWRTQRNWAYTGWQWAAIYLDLVQALMGRPAAELLKASYRANGVRWKEKKVVEVTPEMLARLEAARAKL